MKEFAEFEPSCWLEDGLVVEFERPSHGAFGKRVATFVAALAISLGSSGYAYESTLRLESAGMAEARPSEGKPFEVADFKGGRDLVPPGYWSAMRTILKTLPQLPPEPPEPDEAPFI
jgi:hypothetical protein